MISKACLYAFLAFALFTNVSCGSDVSLSQTEEIELYLNNNGIIPEFEVSKVVLDVIDQGSIDTMTTTSTVTMTYTGEYLNGEVFDNTQSETPVKLKLTTAIFGLKIGLPHFGKGGRGTIIIPSSLAYGNSPPRGIKKNTVLVYHIHVIDF